MFSKKLYFCLVLKCEVILNPEKYYMTKTNSFYMSNRALSVGVTQKFQVTREQCLIV